MKITSAVPYQDPVESYKGMNKYDLVREMRLVDELLFIFEHRRSAEWNKHTKRINKYRELVKYDSIQRMKRDLHLGKITLGRYHEQASKFDKMSIESELRQDVDDYMSMMIMNLESLKWYLQDVAEGRDFPKQRPKKKKPRKKRKVKTYYRHRQDYPW